MVNVKSFATFGSFALVMAGLVGGCASKTALDESSSLRHMAFDSTARNVIVLAGVGDYSGREGMSDLPGSAPDIDRLTRLYRDEYHWEVIPMLDRSSADVLAATQRAAGLLGASSTLHFHYEGHGSQEGTLIFGDRDITFADVSRAIRAGRADPVKRLLVTVDACYSGNTVNGATRVPTTGNAANTFAEDNTQRAFVNRVWSDNEANFGELMRRNNTGGGATDGQQEDTSPSATLPPGDVIVQNAVTGLSGGNGLALADDEAQVGDLETAVTDQAQQPAATPVFEELVVIGSSLQTQTAADWAADGGPFNVAWRAALATAAANQRETPRVRDFLEGLRLTTKRLTANQQEPVYRVEPAGTGDRPLFGSTTPAR